MHLRLKLLFFFILYFTIATVHVFCVEKQHLNDGNKIKNLNQDYKSAIVVDAKNGEILYSYNPDTKIYPASLTKMMTSYLLFSAIDNGIIGINDKISTNKDLTVKDLIYKMNINSRNDITNLLAVEAYGSVAEFIDKMNETAKKMNMKNTHFSNTHGLFNDTHYSTVRDIAKLSIRLVYDFPQYIDIFGITNYIDENREYNVKTTTIQQNIKGVEGSKTGYIEASGYNLSIWGHYGDRHLFIVISGANNKISRDAVVIKLLDSILNNSNINNNINNLNKKNNQDLEIVNKLCNFIGVNCYKYTFPTPEKRKNTNNNYFIKN